MRRFFSLGATVVLVVLASAVVASAASPLQEYQRTGRISPCKYSPGQLGGGVPNDVAQYAPEYKTQLEAAARQRARGCGSSGGGGAASGGGGAGGGGGAIPGGSSGSLGSGAGAAVSPAPPIDPTTGAPATTAQPTTATGSEHAGTSAWLLVLLILGGLALLGGAAALVGRYLGWSPKWVAPAMHALREAGMRIGTTAGGFADWARPAARSS